MKIIEQFSISRTGHLFDCEDQIFISSAFAAVIDGATARNNQLYEGRKSGLAAAMITKNALETLAGPASLKDTLDCVTSSFLAFYQEHGIQPEQHDKILTASAIIYSRFFNQIWMVGDCQCLTNGRTYTNPNGIDDFVAGIRCFINQAELLKGKSFEWIMENDPGSAFIKNLLVDQFLFQNLAPSAQGSYHYTAFDGRPIREESVKVIQLEESFTEIILASDGYPVLCQTLQQSEDKLAEILKMDPLCIYEHKSVKGMKKGLISFDDRAFLKIAL